MLSSRSLIGLLFLSIAAGIGWKCLDLVRYASTPLNPQSEKVAILQVQKGISRQRLADSLEKEGIIESPQKFIWVGKLTHNWSKLRAGEYEVSPAMSPLKVFSVLTSGISITYPLTIKEGDNLYQVAQSLEAKHFGDPRLFIKLCKDPEFIQSLKLGNPAPPTLEGYLFPDTYRFPRSISTQDILHTLIARFKTEWTFSREQDAQKLGLTKHQVITLASIIEKETGAPEERPLISSIFHNRLAKKMRLESDPTTIYGIWSRYTGNLKKSDLQEKTPYNTYAISGLPVGPISNPGTESISAALHPATSDFLFFVSKNDGTHQFTRNYQDHSKAVRALQINPSAREGKSWRDLKKRSH